MTNRSSRHVKVHKHQTMGMLKNCVEDQICTIHRIVTFEQTSQKGKEVKFDLKPVKKQLYHIPSRNKKTGLFEVNTLMKEEELSPVIRINEIGPQQDCVEYKKSELQDAPIDRQIRLDLDKLLKDNDNAFATDERQIGTIKMEIDTGDHPCIAKMSYTLALKHYDWVKDETDKLLEAGVIREGHSRWSAPIVVVPKGDGGIRLCVDYRGINAITRTYVWPMSRMEDIFSNLGKARFYR